MAIAAGVVLATAILGYLPVALRVLGPSVLAQAQSLLVGMGVRMFLTLGVLLASWNGDWLPHRAAFLAWIGLLYAVVLTIETVLVSRGLRPGPESVEESPPSPAPSNSMAGVSVATVSVPTLLGRSASA